MAVRYTLGAAKRLKREKDIEALFRTGKAFSVFPIRIMWRVVPGNTEQSSVLAAFSAPKKKFKKASERNRIKRLLREAWRKQCPDLEMHIPQNQQLHIFILFTDYKLPQYDACYSAITQVIQYLNSAIKTANIDA